jgi:predicted HD superfamily hydrolase involved in NAD metabolism
METSVRLAKKYNCDIEKAKLAGLLHDCAKFPDKTYLLNLANDFDIILDDVLKYNYELIHGPLGAIIAEKEYNIKDREILDAIKFHTTGRENMTLLDKIIYISDYIEPGRDFPGVEKVRSLAFDDLDGSILLAIDNTIEYLIDQKSLIHLNTIKARNYMIQEKIEGDDNFNE